MDLKQFDGHTPGPWRCILNNPLAHGDVVTSEGDVVARIRGWGWLQKLPDGAVQQDANGRLMAASPELLAEVRRLTTELAQAREVLSRLEWDSWGYDPYAGGRSHCPCCGWTKDEGHAPDCELYAVL